MEPDAAPTARTVVFTDLDGTLLDAATYSFQAAEAALAALRARGIPLVIVSSKTRAEIEPIRQRLGISAPFVVENGGAVFIPPGCFNSPVPHALRRDRYEVIELGKPYADLRRALRELARSAGVAVKCFGDMTVEEVAERTGLPAAGAALAARREYDEPFAFDGPPEGWEAFCRQAEARGLRCTRGGRFHHLTGAHDKGLACRLLMDCYRREDSRSDASLFTIGLGDSLNDLPMLEAVAVPVLVRRPDGSYDPEVRLSNLRYAPGAGPQGWNQAVLELVKGERRKGGMRER